MTDITDQDRRAARAWAKNWQGDQDDDTSAAARVILATVDAPAPTLAEELVRIAENSPVWTIRHVCDELKSAAARAEQVEHDLAEARAGRDRLQAQVQGLVRRDGDHNSEVRMLTEERDKARAEVGRLTVQAATAEQDRKLAWRAMDKAREEKDAAIRERDEARAEVERLTAVNEELRRTDNYREFKEFLGVQKGAESNAESIDPADVKPGEAWAANIWYGDEQYSGIAIKSAGGDWNVCRDEGTHSTYRMNEYVELIARLVPAPRVITNPDELEHLAATSIIRDGRGWPGGVTDQGVIMINGFCVSDEEVLGHGPATVLWEP